MYRKSSRSFTKWLPVTVLLAALLACNALQVAPPATGISGQNELPTTSGEQIAPPPAAETTQPPAVEVPSNTPITHTMVPGEPPTAFLSEMTDRNSSEYATQRRANGGENYNGNLYERPFNANTMDTYFPDLDIIRARLTRDDRWVFVNITLVGPNTAGGMLGDYGVELDLNVDGRGDVLVMAAKPGAAWSTDGVHAWKDDNHDVGAAHPIQSDAPSNGDGYETVVFDQGVGADPDTAWARVSPSDPNVVQIAFKRGLINDDDKFTWGAWAMNDSMLHPDWFDYNDHFTAAEAGSSLIESANYPLKSLAELDNTCRWAVGFTPTGSEPGICPVPPTPTPELPATISGLAWYDANNNGVRNLPVDYGIAGVGIRVRSGGCGSPGGVVTTATTDGSGNYSVTVPAGTYCVDVPTKPPVANEGTGPVSVTVPNGGAGHADFRFWYNIY